MIQKAKNILLLIFVLFVACNLPKSEENNKLQEKKYLIDATFQQILDTANLDGVILFYDKKNDTFYANDFEKAKKGHLPASTFKIPNSIIGLETDVIIGENMVFEWDGKKRFLAAWEKDLNLKQAFQMSCVPCYQEVARKVGFKRMKSYTEKLEYGKLQFDETTIDNFWLQGKSKINAFQQIDFLKRFYEQKLDISDTTYQIMKRIFLLEKNENYLLSGKTGWSIQNETNNGWFVGYFETEKNIYFFATNITPKANFNMNLFANMRKKVTMAAFQDIKASM